MKNKLYGHRDRAQISASAAARSSRARLVSVVHRGERLTTENYVENLGNVMVSCLNRFQLPQRTRCGQSAAFVCLEMAVGNYRIMIIAITELF